MNKYEYDIKGIGEFIRYEGDGLYINCKGRVEEIADIMHDLGFKMGVWYKRWTNIHIYKRMYLSSGEVHMDYGSGKTIIFEDLLEMFRIEEAESDDLDLSELLFK